LYEGLNRSAKGAAPPKNTAQQAILYGAMGVEV
jgi:hypothetical protein